MTETAKRPAANASRFDPIDATDEQLLARYRETGDVEAFDALVHRYEKEIYSYLARYLHSESLAQEVFQATFLRVHEKCGLFTEDRSFRPWLYSIATHLAIDALRKEGRHKLVSLDEPHRAGGDEVGTLLNLLQSTNRSPLEQLDADERAEWTRQAVDALPDHQRVVLMLIYFQGLKYREVAEILQLPLGTVKSRVHKALLALNAAWLRNHPED